MTIEHDLAIRFLSEFPAEAIRIVEALPPEEAVALLEGVPVRVAAGALSCANATLPGRLSDAMEPSVLAGIIDAMEPDPSLLMLRRLSASARAEVLAGIDSKKSEVLARRLLFGEHQIGSAMNHEFFSCSVQATVRDVLRVIRRHEPHVGHYLYCLEEHGLLSGYVEPQALLSARRSERLARLRRRDIGTLHAADPVSVALTHRDWIRFPELPVVDERGALVGVLENRVVRSLEDGRAGGLGPAETAVRALGELYGIGFGGILKGAATAVHYRGSEEL